MSSRKGNKSHKKTTLRDYLEKKGIQPSFHRIQILEYLMQSNTHPTVEKIHRDISVDITTLSKTTVYNTLNLFVEKGLAFMLTIDENEIRFEAAINPHAHLKCTKCGNIYDINFENEIFNKKAIYGHSIDEVQVYMKGICSSCIKSCIKS